MNICIYNVPPTIPIKSDNRWKVNYEIKHFNSDEDRKRYVEYFNLKLEEYAKINKYLFVDIWKNHQDKNGFLKLEDSCNVHINNSSFLKVFLDKHNMK